MYLNYILSKYINYTINLEKWNLHIKYHGRSILVRFNIYVKSTIYADNFSQPSNSNFILHVQVVEFEHPQHIFENFIVIYTWVEQFVLNYKSWNAFLHTMIFSFLNCLRYSKYQYFFIILSFM
jgi:hypothetical protein